MKFNKNCPNVNYDYIDKDLYDDIIKLKKKIDNIYIKSWNYLIKSNNVYESVPYLDNKKRISRAFYKLLEIDKIFKIINKGSIVTGHLCESPGGFIECVKHVNNNSLCLTQSLKDSDCEYSKIIKNKCVITYGPDNSGDIYKPSTIRDFIKLSIEYNKCDLMTGDGGFDVSKDYLKQEQVSFKLIYCQTITSLGCLKIGGNYVCKIFDTFTDATNQLIIYLSKKFKYVNIYKPKISRPCNSEKYIICRNFNGISEEELEQKINCINNFEKGYVEDMDVYLDEKSKNIIKNINKSIITFQITSLKNIFNIYENVENYSSKNEKKYIEISKKYLDDIL